MPPPAKPCIPSVAAGMSAQEAAHADPDFLYFLRHVRLDGNAYALVIPSEDGVSSPPQVVRYDQPLPDHNAGSPVAGSNCGGQREPPSWENPWATSEAAPHGMKRKAPDASPGAGGDFRSGAVPMEEDVPTPVAESAWYDSQPDIDDDYSFFLQHAREVEGEWVFMDGNCSIPIGEAEEQDDTEEEEEGEDEEEDEDEVDNTASGQSGEDGISTEEKDDEEEGIPASVTEVGVDSDLPILKVKEEVVSKEDDGDLGPGSDLQIVNEMVYYETKKVEGGEKPLNSLIWGTTDLDPLDKKEGSSSKGHLGMPLNTSELQGVIWPPHINERPNSVFKEKLIECLMEPFTQEEYDKHFAMVTDRRPLLKERRTRSNKVAVYPWMHETGKSYFDMYPDLAEQFSLQHNKYPKNGLALLRGLVFWLQNVTQEDSFKPWSGEFKKYRVVIEE